MSREQDESKARTQFLQNEMSNLDRLRQEGGPTLELKQAGDLFISALVMITEGKGHFQLLGIELAVAILDRLDKSNSPETRAFAQGLRGCMRDRNMFFLRQ